MCINTSPIDKVVFDKNRFTLMSYLITQSVFAS